MRLSALEFNAYDDRCGHHKATTFSFNSRLERDDFAALLNKDRSVMFVKNKDVERLSWTEYWVTAHYKKKQKFERASSEYCI